ncbi:hypothetical protein [Chamaesiphon sp.]|uniref:hypothetical protein n=1 Tax=Chamaesiphon sp. TaxID=2814140 RepID=UPI0035930609
MMLQSVKSDVFRTLLLGHYCPKMAIAVADLAILGNNTEDTTIELVNQINFQNFRLCEF